MGYLVQENELEYIKNKKNLGCILYAQPYAPPHFMSCFGPSCGVMLCPSHIVWHSGYPGPCLCYLDTLGWWQTAEECWCTSQHLMCDYVT